MIKDRILLKLSGAHLKSEGSSTIFTHEVIHHLTTQIKKLSKDYAVAIVVGGGNIWRGAENILKPLDSQDAHVIGMLATMINAIALQNYLKSEGLSAVIFSSIPCPRIAEDMGSDRIDRALNSGEIVIFAGGTGMPYVSTDTCAAVRALEIGAKKILIGKNGVKGVYDSDPLKNKNAKFLSRVSYEEVIDKKLGVMDLSSMILLQGNVRPRLIVFNQGVEDAFVKAANEKMEFTEIV